MANQIILTALKRQNLQLILSIKSIMFDNLIDSTNFYIALDLFFQRKKIFFAGSVNGFLCWLFFLINSLIFSEYLNIYKQSCSDKINIMKKGSFNAHILDKQAQGLLAAKQSELPILPYGIKKPYRKGSSKYRILPNITQAESTDNQNISDSHLRISKEQLIRVPEDMTKNKYNGSKISQSQSQVQMYQPRYQKIINQYGKGSFQKSSSFSQARNNINTKKSGNLVGQNSISQAKIDLKRMDRTRITQSRKQSKINLNVSLQQGLMQNHHNLSKHFQQQLNYQYESIHPNLQNQAQKNQLMKKQSIYIYIRKYLNAAYGQEGQLPKMRVKNLNKKSYQHSNHNIKSRNRLQFNIQSKPQNNSRQNESRLSKIISSANGNKKFAGEKKRIQSYKGHDKKLGMDNKKKRNYMEVQLKKQQYSRPYLKNRKGHQKQKQFLNDFSHQNQDENQNQAEQNQCNQSIFYYGNTNQQGKNEDARNYENCSTKQMLHDLEKTQNFNNNQNQLKQEKDQQNPQKKVNSFMIQNSEGNIVLQQKQQEQQYHPIDHEKQLDTLLEDQRKMIQSQNFVFDAKISYQKHQLRELDQILQAQSDQQKQKTPVLSSDHMGDQKVQTFDVSVQMSEKILQQRSIQCQSQSQSQIKLLEDTQNQKMIQPVQTRQKSITCDDIPFNNIIKPETKEEQIDCDISVKQQQLKEIQRRRIFQQSKLKQRIMQVQKQRQVKQKIKMIKAQICEKNMKQMKDMKHSLKDIIQTVVQMNSKADQIQQKFDSLSHQSKYIQNAYLNDLQKSKITMQNNKLENQIHNKKMDQKYKNLENLAEKFKCIKNSQAENRKKQLEQLHTTINELQRVKKEKLEPKKTKVNTQNIFTSPIVKVRQYRYQQEDMDMYPILQNTKQYDQISQQNPLESYIYRGVQQKSQNLTNIGVGANIREISYLETDKYTKISYEQFKSIQNMESYNIQTYQYDDNVSVSIDKSRKNQDKAYLCSKQSSISVSQYQKQSQSSSELFGDYLYQSSLYQSKIRQNISFVDTSESNKRLQSKFTQTRNNINNNNKQVIYSSNIKVPFNSEVHIQNDQFIHI